VLPPYISHTLRQGKCRLWNGEPLFTTQLDGLTTKCLGETAAKLRLIFEAIQQTRAVYLFDEFDALGGEPAARKEVEEIGAS
jgi:ATPase family associated with various cellular activities (AAA)